MPRLRINLHDIDEIADLEQQEDWERQIGQHEPEPPRPAERDRARGGSRELRFGGSEARDRKRSERRKEIARSARRYSQQRP